MKSSIKTSVLKLLAGLLIGQLPQTSTIGASWDLNFHDTFVNDVQNGFRPTERASCVATLGGDVYVGTSSDNYNGRLFHYNESVQTWEELASFEPNGVSAISGAQQSDNTKYLFVGGSFTNVTYGANSSAANNVVALNVTSSGIIQLGSGTDGPVYALKALPWQDDSGGTLYPGMRCVVGGEFSTAGSVSSKSIALWQQGSAVPSTWTGFSGGLADDGLADLPKVNAIEAKTTGGSAKLTEFDGIWITGALRRDIGGNSAVHIAKLSGPTNTWTYLGRAFQEVAVDEFCTTGSFSVYASFVGKAICRAGTTIHFGGYGKGHQRDDGTPLIMCRCVGQDTGLVSVGTTSTSITSSCIENIWGMAAKGSDVYASGELWEESGQIVYFGKLSGGTWSPLVSGGPDSYATSAATTASNVYFVNFSCWRYTP